jgi:uncharacterized integral membrane protein
MFGLEVVRVRTRSSSLKEANMYIGISLVGLLLLILLLIWIF